MRCESFFRNVDDVSPPLSAVIVTLSKLVVLDFIRQAYHFTRQQYVSNEYVTSLFSFICFRLRGKVDKSCELLYASVTNVCAGFSLGRNSVVTRVRLFADVLKVSRTNPKVQHSEA
jgi:hypothetical protein